MRLELAEAADDEVGAGAHLSTIEVIEAVPPPVDDAAAAAASLLPRMKSFSDELEPHFEDPDGLQDGRGYCDS